jgi:hypothetical protein
MNDIKKLIAEESAAAESAEMPAGTRPTRRGHGRAQVLSIRLNPDENAALIAAADRARLPVSTYVRTLILKELAAPSRGGSTIHPSRSSAIPEIRSLKRRISA